MGSGSTSSMSPVSSPASICMMVTPVSASPGFDGAVDGGGTPPARQQRGMDVQAAQPGQVQHPLRQDQPVGGHHHHVRLPPLQMAVAGGGGIVRVLAVQPQAARLGHGNAMLPAQTA
jgi:hypothetical protein